MSEAIFRQHLNQLINILGQLQGDLESGTIGQAAVWYDEITETVLGALEDMEDSLNPRMGYDPESLEDEDVVESSDLEGTEEEPVIEETELEETALGTDEEDQEATSNQRVFTININLRS